MERDLDRRLAPIECVPQDVTRVLLNLIGNGFYAALKFHVFTISTGRNVLSASRLRLVAVTTRLFRRLFLSRLADAHAVGWRDRSRRAGRRGSCPAMMPFRRRSGPDW
jgi:hypothetical protein